MSSRQHEIDESAQIVEKEQSEVEQPPQTPNIQPRLKLYNYQKIGIPILLLIPILALLGVFGVSTERTQAANDEIAVELRYPTRFRYKMINTIDVAVTNQSASPIDSVIVRFDRDYINRFSTVTFTPSVSQITDQYYEVELKDIPPDGMRVVNVTIQSEYYGYHRGEIVVQAATAAPVQFEVSTFSLP